MTPIQQMLERVLTEEGSPKARMDGATAMLKVEIAASKDEGASKEYLAEPRRLLKQLEEMGPAKMLETIRAQ